MNKKLIITFMILVSIIEGANCAVIKNDINTEKNVENYIIAQNSEPILQDYIISSSMPIKKVSSSNENVAKANIMSTIMNERNIILLNSINVGNTVLSVIVNNQEYSINVTVKKNKTIVKTNCPLFELTPLDVPDYVLDLPEEARS